MQLLVLGVDDEGRSYVAEERSVVLDPIAAVPGTSMASLFTTDQSPPPPCPPGVGRFVEGRLAPGLVSWYVVDHEPGEAHDRHAGAELHHRNSLEMVVILHGSADLLLHDGEHALRAGDCIVMPGSDHGLRTGPDGCRLMAFEIGTPLA